MGQQAVVADRHAEPGDQVQRHGDRDVAAVEQDALAVEGDVAVGRPGDPDGAVHRARVEVGEAEPLGHRARDGALAGTRRAVDRDHHGP